MRIVIVIVAYLPGEETERLLDSLLAHTNGLPWEGLLILNGVSADGAAPWNKHLEGTSCSTCVNPDNLGWTTAANQGLKYGLDTAADFIVLMNNDVLLSPGWLGRLITPMTEDETIGLTGPVTNFASGPQGCVHCHRPEDISHHADLLARYHGGKVEFTPRLVGFCLAVRRQVVEELGGLDTRFKSDGFDDDDYCIRAQRAGWRCAVAHDSFVFHEGHTTFRKMDHNVSEGLTRGWERFSKKWRIDGLYGQIPYRRLIAAKPGRKDYFPL